MIKKREFQKFKSYIVVYSWLLDFFPKKFAIKLLVCSRHVYGRIGIGLRYCSLKRICKSCGENVVVYPGAYLTYLESCVLGNNISIHENCNIGCKGGLSVGDNVMISQGVSILTTEHDYLQLAIPMRDAPIILKSVSIGNDVWIGAHAVITSGVKVGQGSVIGAGCVVTKDIPSWSIAVGVPARIIKTRKIVK